MPALQFLFAETVLEGKGDLFTDGGIDLVQVLGRGDGIDGQVAGVGQGGHLQTAVDAVGQAVLLAHAVGQARLQAGTTQQEVGHGQGRVVGIGVAQTNVLAGEIGPVFLVGGIDEQALGGDLGPGLQHPCIGRGAGPAAKGQVDGATRLGGVEAIEQIRTFDPAASIVILTTYQGDEDVYRALRAGAKAYLLKDSGPDQLTDCLRTVASGKQFLPAAVASKLAERQTSSPLSRRELEILAHLATGKSNKMIARSAAIEVGTVKFHVNNILAKLNVGSRTEAATVAARRGLISAF